jgi:uncharacterized protein YifE (UPF0438 family)
MTAKEKHKAYLKKMGEYPIDCNTDAFNDEEMECIRKYGYWYKALCDEILVPFTWLQEQFIRVYKGELEPFSIHEVAWTKYVGQKNAESKPGDYGDRQYLPYEDTFYSREMYRKQHKIMYGVIADNHRR